MSVKRVNHFIIAQQAAGTLLAWTYDEIAEDGTKISDNNKGNKYIMDKDIQLHADAIKDWINKELNQ